MKQVGVISISYHVDCPHCDETLYSDVNVNWWDENFGVDFGVEGNDFVCEYEVKCEECKRSFEVGHFEV